MEKSAFEQASFVTEKQLGGVEQSLRIDIESSSRSLKHTLETQITELQDSLAYTAKKRIEDEVAIDSLKSAVEQLTKQLGQQWDAQQGKLDHMAEEFTAKLQLAADATEEAVAAAGRAKNKGVDASALKMPDGRTLQEALTSLEDRYVPPLFRLCPPSTVRLQLTAAARTGATRGACRSATWTTAACATCR